MNTDFQASFNCQGQCYTFPVPHWTQWLAVDKHGSVWAYEIEPVLSSMDMWSCRNSSSQLKCVGQVTTPPVTDWAQHKYGLSNAARVVERTTAPIISSNGNNVDATF